MANTIVERDGCTVLKWGISVGCTRSLEQGVIVLELLEKAVPSVPVSALC